MPDTQASSPQTPLEQALAALALDRENLEALAISSAGWLPTAAHDSLIRAIASIDAERVALIERSTFAIAGQGFDTIFGPDVTSAASLSSLAEAAAFAMSVPRPDFCLDPAQLDDDARAEHEDACTAYAEAQKDFLDLATEERVLALSLLGDEVLNELGRASLAELPLRDRTPRSPSA